MSHQIVECPGCLTKLRVRESSERIILACPRCSEQLAVDPPEHLTAEKPKAPPRGAAPSSQRPTAPKPAPPVPSPPTRTNSSSSSTSSRSGSTSESTSTPRRTPQQPSWMKPRTGGTSSGRATGSRRDEGGYDDWEQAPPQRAGKNGARGGSNGDSKKGMWIGLGVGGGVLTIGLILFFVLRGGDDNSGTAVASNSTDATLGTTPINTPPVGGNNPTPDGNAGIPAPTPPVGNAGANGFAGQPVPPNPPIQPSPPVAGNSNGVPPVAVAGGLSYHWKQGVELSYNFTVEHGSGDAARKTTGICNYTVAGDIATQVDNQQGSGTGFVVGANGVIATCEHVVEGAKNIEVVLGGRTYPATVIGVDTTSDVALIQIQASGLQPLTMIDSEAVQLAESVRAIGYPLSDVLGTDVKITTGTVAGFVPLPGNTGKQIQIDAAINPGNSGGPVVNGAGQVIGIASAKLSGVSVTSVGFVAPVNELRRLAASHNIQLATANRGADISGPDVARQVTPSVAFIKVSGISPGRAVKVNFMASFSEQQQMQNRGGFPFPSPPSFPNSSVDNGSMTVNTKGEITEFDGQEQLPAVLGPVGAFFIEPLDASSRGQWMVEKRTTLQRIKEEQGPFGPRFGPRFGPGFGPGGMRGRFGPPGMFGGPEEKVVEEIPAVEQSSYQIGQTLNNKVSIAKKYDFTATRSNGQPYMKIEGTGTLVFDTQLGMPASLDYTATIEQSDEGTTIRLPVKVNYTLRNPEDVKREREAVMQKMEEDKKKQEQDRTQPNPARVDELIAEIRKAEGGFQAFQPLEQLGNLAVVEDKRADVLKIARNHMQNSNALVKKSATQVFCQWASDKEKDELLKVLGTNDGLLSDAKKKALASLAKILKATDAPILIDAMADFTLRAEARAALIAMGVSVEKPIIEKFPSISDAGIKGELLEVLKKIGTKDSEDFLEKLATSNDFSIKHNAQQALDAVRSRL